MAYVQTSDNNCPHLPDFAALKTLPLDNRHHNCGAGISCAAHSSSPRLPALPLLHGLPVASKTLYLQRAAQSVHLDREACIATFIFLHLGCSCAGLGTQ